MQLINTKAFVFDKMFYLKLDKWRKWQ